ncbi:MAG: hypothetical protein LOD94_17195, partial [Gammaproteobacteria bacterium]
MIELVITRRQRSLGGFDVGRVLPYAKRRMVGPFIFLDHGFPSLSPRLDELVARRTSEWISGPR